MKLGLIGADMHWQTYAPALKAFPDMRLVGVAPAGEGETLGAFDHAPGLTVDTRRYDDARQMLDREKPDVVQVGTQPQYVTRWARECLERQIAVMPEKPLAMDLPNLEALYRTAKRTRTPIVPMHTMRAEPTLAAIAAAVRDGAIGTPAVGFSQKSYKWGGKRPDWYRTRRTFPGIMPFIGVHALDWLNWILGDVFTSVEGSESSAIRPDYPGCASHAAYTFRMKSGGSVAVTLDYLRPEKAPTHGDERVRIAGSKGVVETVLIKNRVTLINSAGTRTLPLTDQPNIFAAFVRSIRDRTPPPIALDDAFRITEIVLKAQEAADNGRAISLADSPFISAG